MWMTGVLLWWMVLTIPSIVSAVALDTTDIPTEYDLDITDIPLEYDLGEYDGGFEFNDTEYFEMSEDEMSIDHWNSTAERQVTNCKNKWRDSSCKRYAAKRYCTRDWVTTNCLRTCNKCPGKYQCGKVNTKRIIGGGIVDPPHKYPWMVRLDILTYDRKRSLCGGSIINDRWILTAAHCVIKEQTAPSPCTEKVVRTPSDIRVWVGDHDRTKVTTDQTYYRVETIEKHNKYDCTNDEPPYDFALLKLKYFIPFNSMIKPICLPTDNGKQWYTQTTGIVTGWGVTSKASPTSKSSPLSYFLREVRVPILKYNSKTGMSTCGKWGNFPPVRMCAGKKDSNTCLGDSGGPLVVYKNGKYVQVGVVSYGYDDNDVVYCNVRDRPTVYGRVSQVLPWIKGVLLPYYNIYT